jgi:hypothetical protein
MAAANDPSPPPADPGAIQPAPQAAGVQAPPPAETPIKLPPRSRPAYLREEQAQGVARLNHALVAVVLALAFLLGSFAVKNSDFWMNLATGRALVQGQYRPWTGQDPFSYTAEGTYWVNHSWLFDLVLYGTYQALGGPAVVILKALLVAALAWVMLRVRRPGEDVWIPAACTGLALLALGPRVLLQPVVVSYLLLAVTLWLLQRSADDGAQADPRRANALWLLPPLFALWVNLDDWFILGPLTVGLFLVGEFLQGVVPFGRGEPAAAGGGARLRRLALVFAVSVAACLVNPHLYRAFTLPADLSPGVVASVLARDREFRWYFLSPFSEPYWHNPNLVGTVASVAFYLLALVGLASFALNRAGWRWWRALLWVAFFLLAAFRWHGVAFFAVVAAPLAALNFQDVAARRRAGAPAPAPAEDGGDWAALVKVGVVLALLLLAVELGAHTTFYTEKLARLGWPEPPVAFLAFAAFVLGVIFFGVGSTLPYFDRVFSSWSLGGRVLTLLAGVGLLVAAWPGWLGPSPTDPELARRVAWAADPDPSLRRLAEWLGTARQTGELGRGFATLPQVASYCAWYCPEEKGFFDHRFTLFADSVPTFLDVRGTATGVEGGEDGPAGGAAGREQRLQDCFRRYNINHVIVASNDVFSNWQRSQELLAHPDRWALLYLDGHSAVFGRKGPGREGAPDAWGALADRPDRRAFGPPSPVERAPDEGQRQPVPVPAWAHYAVGPPRRELKSDEAALHLLRFEASSERAREEVARAWQAAMAARLVTGVAPDAGPVGGPGLLAYRACLGGFSLPVGGAAVDPARPPSPLLFQVADAQWREFQYWQDDGPPALLLLAVRAARQAIAANPQDAQAYLRLEQAYKALRFRTRERAWCAELPALALLRHVQMVTALERAVTVQPDLTFAHLELATLYAQFRSGQNPDWGYIDLELKHFRAAQEQLQRAGRQPQEDPKAYDDRLKELDRQVTELQKTVQKHENQFVVSASNWKVLKKAEKALSLGLAEQALTVLREAEGLELGQRGAQMQFDLMLTTGQAGEAGELLRTEELKGNLGFTAAGVSATVPAYEWYRVVAAAADGAYGDADKQLEELADQKDPRTVLEGRLQGLKEAARVKEPDEVFVCRILGRGLMETPQEKPLAWLAMNHLVRFNETQPLFNFAGEWQEQAELLVLRGLLALEAGKTDEAEAVFRQALAISVPPARCAPFLSLLGAPSPLGAAALLDPSFRAGGTPGIYFPGRPAAVQCVELMEKIAAGDK